MSEENHKKYQEKYQDVDAESVTQAKEMAEEKSRRKKEVRQNKRFIRKYKEVAKRTPNSTVASLRQDAMTRFFGETKKQKKDEILKDAKEHPEDYKSTGQSK